MADTTTPDDTATMSDEEKAMMSQWENMAGDPAPGGEREL